MLQALIHLVLLLKRFIVLKTEFDKLDINKLVNVTTGLNNSKTKVYDLDDDKLKTVPVDLKKLRDVMNKEVVKQMYNKLNMKVNNLDNKIPDVTILIHINRIWHT